MATKNSLFILNLFIIHRRMNVRRSLDIYEIWIIHEWIAHFVYGIYVFLTYLIFEIAPFSNMWPGVGYELWSMYENPSIFSGPNHLEKVSPLNNPCEADEWVCLSVSSGMAYPLECWNVVEHFFSPVPCSERLYKQ